MKHLPLTLASMALAAAAPVAVHAQAGTMADEDITVTGRYGPSSNVQSLSQVVSYADLDLSTKEGRDELHHRLNLTARYLCDKLGESDTSSAVVPSCRDAAVRDAMSRVGTIEAHFAPRGTTWTRPSPWSPPYPADWSQRYP